MAGTFYFTRTLSGSPSGQAGLVVQGAGGGVTFGLTRFLDVGKSGLAPATVEGQAQYQTAADTPLTARGFVVRMRLNTLTVGPAVVTFRIGGIPTPLSASIPPGSTAAVEVPGSVAVPGGSLVSVMLDTTAAAAGSITDVVASYRLVA